MRVLVLGGAGGLGSAAARTLAAGTDVDSITLADLDGDGIRRLASELGPIADATQLDVQVRDDIVELVAHHDVVVNCAGPYTRSAELVLDAAIGRGVSYIDACDDALLTPRLLARRIDARAAGVAAVIGAGLSPGLSNVVAVVAARELDEIINLRTGWSVDAGEGAFRAREDLMVDDATQRPPAAFSSWLDRIVRDVEVGSGRVLSTMDPHHLHFPGIGSGTAWSSGHPEQETLPRHFEVSGSCENLMVMRRTTAAYLLALRRDVKQGKIDADEAADLMIDRPLRRRLRAKLEAARTPGGGALPAFFAVAEGRRDGPFLRVGARLLSLPQGLEHTAGVTLALAAQMLGAGDLVAPGVHSPEEALEPDILLEHLAPWCEPPFDGASNLVDVTIEPT